MANSNNKRRDLKITWMSNSVHTNSGYAVESRDLLFRFLQDEWDLSMIGQFGNEGYHNYLNGDDLVVDKFKGLKLKVYPKMNDPYGSDALVEHSSDFGAHVAFVMLDIWTLNQGALMELGKRNIKFIPYLPIDQEPPQPGILANLNSAYKIITFSKFGQRVLEDHGFTSTYIEEGIDTDIFKPMDKIACRKELGIPEDIFLFGMIGANKENPPRKGYQEALEAFKRFSENHPEARFYFHTQQTAPTGFPIVEYADYLGIKEKILFMNPYKATFKSDSYIVAKEINCLDVLLHPSQTEGFGLLTVESQSCGVPVIVNRCHSQPELVIDGKTGEICETGKPWFRNLGAYVYPADVNSLYDKMEKLYRKVKDEKVRVKIQKAARDHILQNYDINRIVNKKWIPFLEDLQEEILPVSK